MKLVQQYGAYTINTAITKEQFEAAKRYAPQSLILMENDSPVFAVDCNTKANGSVGKHGITFNAVAQDKTLYVTMPCVVASTETTETLKAKLENEFGMILFNLGKIEAQVNAAVEAASAAIATVSEAIVIG